MLKLLKNFAYEVQQKSSLINRKRWNITQKHTRNDEKYVQKTACLSHFREVVIKKAKK